jgi:hypothetical protein
MTMLAVAFGIIILVGTVTTAIYDAIARAW